jgi:hypothetical protein
VRTTLTLDPDVAARVKQAARRAGLPFKQVVNDLLRAGLTQATQTVEAVPFQVKPHNFGGLRQGVSVDSIAELLENLDGPSRR